MAIKYDGPLPKETKKKKKVFSSCILSLLPLQHFFYVYPTETIHSNKNLIVKLRVCVNYLQVVYVFFMAAGQLRFHGHRLFNVSLPYFLKTPTKTKQENRTKTLLLLHLSRLG